MLTFESANTISIVSPRAQEYCFQRRITLTRIFHIDLNGFKSPTKSKPAIWSFKYRKSQKVREKDIERQLLDIFRHRETTFRYISFIYISFNLFRHKFERYAKYTYDHTNWQFESLDIFKCITFRKLINTA